MRQLHEVADPPPRGFVAKLEIFPDLEVMLHAGYTRGDVPVLHTIVRAAPGQPFPVTQLKEHFATCAVCLAHTFTLDKFVEQWPAALAGFGQRFQKGLED